MNLRALAALGIPLILASPLLSQGQVSNFKHITIDGSFQDWAGIAPMVSDGQENPDATDIKEVYMAHDEQFLYVRFSLYGPANPFTARNNFFLNADADASTGFSGGRGAELLIQGGAGYQEKGGLFNEGGVDGLQWSAAPSGAASQFEFRISRKATYSSDGSPVFTSDQISLLLEAESPSFARVEEAPDSGAVLYDLSSAPSPFPGGSLPLIALQDTAWSLNSSGSDLGLLWLDLAFDPTGQIGWSSGPGLFGFTGNAGDYPKPIQTPTPAAVSRVYLRTTFDWNYDTVGVLLTATNYLSDGAVYYMNGALVKKVRTGNGPTQTNPTPGQPELLVLSPDALVIGKNILSVELLQTPGDTSDLVFGLSLTAADLAPLVNNTPTEPADREVIEGQPTTLRVDLSGTEPITYQWFKGSEPIVGATAASYTLPVVLQSDAGAYHAEASNPATARLRSRTAVLTTKAVAVAIVNGNTSPADQTVPEGRPVTFSVETTGSAPLTFQWYKNDTAILGAITSTYALTAATPADAGRYSVVVGNRLPTQATSRKALLIVQSDKTAPKVLSVVGSASKVTLQFDEPLDPASAILAANYSFAPSLAVSSVTLDIVDPSKVILNTAPQVLGTLYTVSLQGVKDLFSNSVQTGTTAKFRSTIVIDGSFDDWAGVTALASDDQDSTDSTDWKDVFIANDDDYIYVRITLHSPATWPTSFFYNNLYFDADANNATGLKTFNGIGSEMLIQGGGGYQEKNGAFNEGGVDELDWLIAPESQATDFEFRVSRHATYASDGQRVFRSSGFDLVLEAETIAYATRDLAPNTGVIHYKFQPETLDPINTSVLDGALTLSWTGDGVLQSRASLTSGEWQDVADQTNPQTLDSTAGAQFFRLVQP